MQSDSLTVLSVLLKARKCVECFAHLYLVPWNHVSKSGSESSIFAVATAAEIVDVNVSIKSVSRYIDIRSPPSNHFEKLRGKLSGKHSIRGNKQWGLVFEWSDDYGDAQNIYRDNHDYR